MNDKQTMMIDVGIDHRAGQRRYTSPDHLGAVGARQVILVWLRHLVIALAVSYVLALSARIQAPVPMSPVPVTGQTFVILLMGALLPRPYIWSTLGCYLVMGTMGLPYFAGSSLIGPTGGYLLGFFACALVVNALMARGWGRTPHGALLALLLGNALIYAVGLPWLALFVGTGNVLALGLWPFVVGDLFKLVCASGIVVARYQL